VGGTFKRRGPADERGRLAELRPQGLVSHSGVVSARRCGRQVARMMTPRPRAVLILGELIQDLPAQGRRAALWPPDGQRREGLGRAGEPFGPRPAPG